MIKALFSPLLALVLVVPAFASIPPSQFILKSMVGRHVGVKSVRVSSHIVALDDGKPTSVRFRQISVFDPKTRILRNRAYNEAGQEIFSIDRKLDSSADSDPVPAFLLFGVQTEAVARRLLRAGIPIRLEDELLAMKDEEERMASERTSLGRLGTSKKTVAWIIGETKPGEPQLWVEKDAFLPLRWRVRTDIGMIDGMFEGTRFFHEFPFPRAIVVSRAPEAADVPAEPLLREEISEVQVNGELPEMKGGVSGGLTAIGQALDSATKELILSYYRFVR